MEKLFQYVWKHKLFPLKSLTTTDGRTLEVVDVGLQNYDSGPDFFNAKVKIDGTLWVGNVEIHMRSNQWYQHGHESNPAYDNVILHVVTHANQEVFTSQGKQLPQLELPIPQHLKNNYEHLLTEDRYPRCHKIIRDLPLLTIHSWMAALQTERLERKTHDIQKRVADLNGSWEDAYFQTLARNFGFGVNGDAFEAWSRNLPLRAVDHHRDNLFQVEALFLGQAGLLDINHSPLSHRKEMEQDSYFYRIKREYDYLSHKFGLVPIDGGLWRFLRLRPQNFPYIRISQLANLYYNRKAGFSQILECQTVEEIKEALKTQVSEYWQTHYVFGVESEKSLKHLAKSSLDVIIINTVVPLLFAYGRYKQNEKLAEHALDLLEQIKPENNNIIRLWNECGLNVSNAGDSQALIQLKKEYCDKKDCLRCRIGYQFMKVNSK